MIFSLLNYLSNPKFIASCLAYMPITHWTKSIWSV